MESANKARILVVDDNRINRMVMEGRLSQAGYAVDAAVDGHQALELLGLGRTSDGKMSDRFDAIVLDIMMPEIDGLEVLRQVRQVKSANELPVIMATTKDRSEDIVQALEAGSNDYVTKPIDMQVLLARLRTQVSLKQTHVALKKAQASLIEAAKMESVGYLAAGVAHEVRNPLAQIQMGVEAIERDEAVKAAGDLGAVIEIVQEAVRRTDSIIQKLMKVSTQGKFELKPGLVNELIEEAMAAIKSDDQTRGLVWEINLEKDLPLVPLAKVELCQVFSNLLANAIEAMPKGGTLSVRTRRTQLEDVQFDEGLRSGLRLRSGGPAVLLEITDTGAGIPEDKLQAIWDPFFTTKPTGQGTGLGLSLSKKVIQLHHGLISIENRKEQSGARVVIYLPTADSRGISG